MTDLLVDLIEKRIKTQIQEEKTKLQKEEQAVIKQQKEAFRLEEGVTNNFLLLVPYLCELQKMYSFVFLRQDSFVYLFQELKENTGNVHVPIVHLKDNSCVVVIYLVPEEPNLIYTLIHRSAKEFSNDLADAFQRYTIEYKPNYIEMMKNRSNAEKFIRDIEE